MGPGRSLSSGRPKAGPVGRDDKVISAFEHSFRFLYKLERGKAEVMGFR
jgi:hypothetical protein